MSTAAIRGILVVGAAILGLLVVTKAFPDTAQSGIQQPATQSQAPGTTTTGPAVSLPTPGTNTVPPTTSVVSPGASPAAGASPGAPAADLRDLAVQVLNGTNENGLAASTAQDLETLGVKIIHTGNASRTYPVTTLFYRDDSKTQAEALVAQKFPGARLEPANNNLNPKVQVTVVIGEDYAAAQG